MVESRAEDGPHVLPLYGRFNPRILKSLLRIAHPESLVSKKLIGSAVSEKNSSRKLADQACPV